MTQKGSRLCRQTGQDLVEYAAFVALAVVIAVIGIGSVGAAIQHYWLAIGEWLSESVGTLP